MTARPVVGGVYWAALTPFDATLSPDPAKAIAWYENVLARGCDGLNVLGTTGEAMSIGLDQRLAFMDAIASALPCGRLMVGTGASALADAVRLTRAAFDLRYAAALIIPPFYYRDASDDGIIGFFDALFERAQPPKRSVLLYNFPRMSGFAFHADLVDRIVKEFPRIISGMKDSSNTLELECEIARRHPDLAVFPASEVLLEQARNEGLAGCISGSVALWPELAARVWRSGSEQDAAEIAALRRSVEAQGSLIAAVRERVAQQTGEDEWRRPMPPLSSFSAAREISTGTTAS